MFEQPPRIPTYLTVEAKIREVSSCGLAAYIAHRGEKMGGLILLKLSDMAGQSKLLTQQRDLEGVLGWIDVFQEEIIEEKKADEYIARAINRDPDLWVVEIEDRQMSNPFKE